MTANLVSGREKRTTAGNRLMALMASQFESEEAFMEVDNDEEFVAKHEEDLFDDDFEETDEDEVYGDEWAGEVALQRDERLAQRTIRQKKNKASLLPRVKLRLKLADPGKSLNLSGSPNKKGRSAVGTAISAETGEMVVRNSLRKATIDRTMQTQARLKAADKRKAKMPKRAKVVHVIKTQDTLIREALELEERNVAALKAFLNREEEKKRHAKVVRTKVEPPLLRWISRTEEMPAPVIEIMESGPRATIQEVSSDKPSLANVQRTDSPSQPPPSTVLSPPSLVDQPSVSSAQAIPATRYSRNYVVLELSYNGRRMREMTALFGRHADWSTAGAERRAEARHRISVLNAQACPITGSKPIYLHPQTGIPFANVRAHQVLSQLIRHRYVWSQPTGMYTNDESDQGAKGVPEQWKSSVHVGGAHSMQPPPPPSRSEW